MVRTVCENVQEMAEGVRNLLEDLLINHSSIYRWHVPGGTVFYPTRGEYAFRELAPAGRQVQARLLQDYRRLYAVLSTLLTGQPTASVTALTRADAVLMSFIEQHNSYCASTGEALAQAATALDKQLRLLSYLCDSSGGNVVYVPDTNALLYNPAVEHWEFSETPMFRLALVPSVLSELDVLKVNHRNESVRRKAEMLIRQIKEYRRRGSLSSGVPIISGKIDLVAIATEPRGDDVLPWLDMQNKDDRFLASTMEVMRGRPRSVVIIVTRDINLQNKAEYACIPYVEPPESVSC